MNATLYASGGLTTKLAEVGQFPPFFGSGSRLGRTPGSSSPAGSSSSIANLVDLSAIASVGSACSLVIFLLVGIAGYRRRAETGSRDADRPGRIARDRDRARLLRGRHAAATRRRRSRAIVAIALLSIVLDVVWKRSRPRRRTHPRPPTVAPRHRLPPERQLAPPSRRARTTCRVERDRDDVLEGRRGLAMRRERPATRHMHRDAKSDRSLSVRHGPGVQGQRTPAAGTWTRRRRGLDPGLPWPSPKPARVAIGEHAGAQCRAGPPRRSR